jgi:site-specific DNA recombinase
VPCPRDSAAQQPITTTVLRKFAATARKRMRIEGGGYRRDHLRALAQRVEVADKVRIMGSKSDLLTTLAAISGVKAAASGVRSSVTGLAETEGFEPSIGLYNPITV